MSTQPDVWACYQKQLEEWKKQCASYGGHHYQPHCPPKPHCPPPPPPPKCPRPPKEPKSKCEPCQDQCCVKIGLIADPAGTGGFVARLLKLKALYPSIKDISQPITILPVPDQTLDEAVDATEAAVHDLVSRGYEKICINQSSTILTPWILGTAGSLAGLKSDKRWPDITFALGFNSIALGGDNTAVISQVGNVIRFGDVVSGDSPADRAELAKRPFSGLSPQKMIIVYETNDNASAQFLATYQAVAGILGIPATLCGVDWDGANYTPATLDAAAAKIAAEDGGATRVIVPVGVNGTRTDNFTDDANARPAPQVFVKNGGAYSSNIQFLAANWAPAPGHTVGAKAWAASAAGDPQPSVTSSALGYPKSPDTLLAEDAGYVFAYPFIEAILYFATCDGTVGFNGDQDQCFALDLNRTRVNYLVVVGDYEPNAGVATSNRTVNSRKLA